MFDKLKKTVSSVGEKLTETAEKVKDGVMDTAAQWKEDLSEQQEKYEMMTAEKKKQAELERYAPLSAAEAEHCLAEDRMLRIIGKDARMETESYQSAVGYYEKTKGGRVPTLLAGHANALGLIFYPQLRDTVYLADPCVPGKYIDIDEYYHYMKQVRVNELTLIAQSLGARHVEIRLNSTEREEKSADAGTTAGLQGKNPLFGGAFRREEKRSSSIQIWADTYFDVKAGAEPTVPQTLYFRNESDIATLIELVCGGKNKLVKRTYSLEAASTSGLSMAEAANVSGRIEGIKCSAGASFAQSAEKESNSVLEYTIEF